MFVFYQVYLMYVLGFYVESTLLIKEDCYQRLNALITASLKVSEGYCMVSTALIVEIRLINSFNPSAW